MLTRVAIVIGLLLLPPAATLLHAVTPVSFHESAYTTLDELDQALEEGEISYDDYLLLIERFLGALTEDVEDEEPSEINAVDTTAAANTKSRKPHFKYHSSFVQKLETEKPFVRYDRLTADWGRFRLDLGYELRTQKQALFRSRSLRYQHAGSELILGSYSLRVGKGVTQGLSSYHSDLREESDFGSSFRRPIKNRHNGVLVRQRFGSTQSGLFVSDLAGAEFQRTAFGAFVEVDRAKRTVGLIFASQHLGRNTGDRVRDEYLAPYFSFAAKNLTLSGESSFGLGSAAAHIYQAAIERSRVKQELTFFSYARNYRNLQSGGYAYSDYEKTTIAPLDFSYSDKRAGRIGVAMSSTLEITSDVGVGVGLVRWNNRIDNRRCVAAKASASSSRFAGKRGQFRLRMIWEDFDLAAGTESRQLISASARTSLSSKVDFESLAKTERRRRSEMLSYPFAVGVDLLWQQSGNLATAIALRYYNPDVADAATDYTQLTIGEKLTRFKLFTLWIRTQTRYLFDQQRLDGWEARVYLDFAT